MKRIFFFMVLIGAILLSGCAYFKTGAKLKECNRLMIEKDSLLVRSQEIVKMDSVIIDMLNKQLQDCKKLEEEWESKSK